MKLFKKNIHLYAGRTVQDIAKIRLPKLNDGIYEFVYSVIGSE